MTKNYDDKGEDGEKNNAPEKRYQKLDAFDVQRLRFAPFFLEAWCGAGLVFGTGAAGESSLDRVSPSGEDANRKSTA